MSDDVHQNALLPLDVPRQINLKAKDRTYSYHFRRLTDRDWAEFFSGIVSHTVQVAGQRQRIYESESASIALVESTLTRVEGFGDVSAVKDWRQALPLRHRIALGMVLRNVGRGESASDVSQLCELDEVRLDAVWPIGGATTLYQGLVHRFRHLTPDQLKRFNSEAASVRTRGDGENAVSIYPSRQLIAMRLYDEVIESVEGYSVAGHPLTGVEAIRAEMDGAHKAEAFLAYFYGGDDVAVE